MLLAEHFTERSKEIIKSSKWHQGFNLILQSYKNTFCVQKRKKRLYSFIHHTDMLFLFRSNHNNVRTHKWHRTSYAVYVQLILSKMALGWRGREELFTKCLFYFCTKSILIASKIYAWTPDVTWIILCSLLRFWTWEHFSCIAVCRVRQLSDSIKNIFICVRKMILRVWNDMRVSN